MNAFSLRVRGKGQHQRDRNEEKNGGDEAKRIIDDEEEIVMRGVGGMDRESGDSMMEKEESAYSREKKKWNGESNPAICPSFSQLAAPL